MSKPKTKKASLLPDGVKRITSYVPDEDLSLLVQCMGTLTSTRGKRFTLSSALSEAIRALARQEGLTPGGKHVHR